MAAYRLLAMSRTGFLPIVPEMRYTAFARDADYGVPYGVDVATHIIIVWLRFRRGYRVPFQPVRSRPQEMAGRLLKRTAERGARP